jgi:hypothetical protein
MAAINFSSQLILSIHYSGRHGAQHRASAKKQLFPSVAAVAEGEQALPIVAPGPFFDRLLGDFPFFLGKIAGENAVHALRAYLG